MPVRIKYYGSIEKPGLRVRRDFFVRFFIFSHSSNLVNRIVNLNNLVGLFVQGLPKLFPARPG
jgi:hypothetical protein